jgi:DNA-binding GntR family transcriptional regulator/flavin reductase (DIM6/NTAB) family NADH-FMN oxidoreductase RutF
MPLEGSVQPAPGVDAGVFRQVIGHFMSGVAVITASHEGTHRGMTVSAIASLSLDPPMIVACLNAASSTQEVVRRAGVFAVNVLAEDQGDLAERFARRGVDPFDGLDYALGVTGAPVFPGALAVLECRIAQEVPGGSHRVLLSDVVRAVAGDGTPLAYFRGRFGRIELAQDAQAHERLRELILTRQLGGGEPLDVEQLAERLGTPPSSVQYALTRLVGESLVSREEDRGHVVRPLDARTSDDAHDARMAMEFGAAELTVGRLGAEALAELRRLAQATVDVLESDTADGVGDYTRANGAFHRYLIASAGVEALSEAYESLSLADLMSRALRARRDIAVDLAREHLELVEAYERGDLAAAKEVIARHADHSKATQRAAIERAGGQL